MTQLQKTEIEEVIKKDFINSEILSNIYLVNGIKMTAYITKIESNKYIILKDKITQTTANHIVFWNTILTINQGTDYNNNNKNESITIDYQTEQNHNRNMKYFIGKNIFIYLSNGIKLDGTCVFIDHSSYILLEKNNNQQIVLWHAIATMSINDTKKQVEVVLSENKKNDIIFNNIINSEVSIFLKTGIKLCGTITDYDLLNDNQWEFVLDKKQIIFSLHISTITTSQGIAIV